MNAAIIMSTTVFVSHSPLFLTELPLEFLVYGNNILIQHKVFSLSANDKILSSAKKRHPCKCRDPDVI